MDNLQFTREKITRLGRLLFERQLTDAAGGNISARVGERVCITPRFAGQKRQWQLRPEEVLVCDLDGVKLEGEGDLSREAKAHFRLYRDFPDGTSVIHCHPRNLLVFCAADQPLLPVIEGTWKFGEIPVVPFAPAHSQALADHVAGAMRGQEGRIRKQAAAVIARWHGLFVLGKDLDAAFDAAERIETNAFIVLQAGPLPAALEWMRQRYAALRDELAALEGL
jgi:L-fuculose-phosphate aldolase